MVAYFGRHRRRRGASPYARDNRATIGSPYPLRAPRQLRPGIILAQFLALLSGCGAYPTPGGARASSRTRPRTGAARSCAAPATCPSKSPASVTDKDAALSSASFNHPETLRVEDIKNVI